jgi:hypothetical protein
VGLFITGQNVSLADFFKKDEALTAKYVECYEVMWIFCILRRRRSYGTLRGISWSDTAIVACDVAQDIPQG